MKRPKELECVVLKRDLPAFGLRAGNVGTVVLVYEPDAVEVEFFDRDGDTHALLTLLDEDVRLATKSDLNSSVRPEPWPDGIDAPIADATVKTRR
jgi:hypothetical protein